MCGIAGEVHVNLLSSVAETEHNVKQMLAALEHRGPDEAGAHAARGAVLGIRRLRVIGRENGTQPVFGARTFAVFNGEIYNYRELREALRRQGIQFRTDSDAEVIPHLYERHGENFVDHLEGMFAIAIFDPLRSTLVLARDRGGEKPLLYQELESGGVIFASELHALTGHPAARKEVSHEAIDRFLSFRVIPAPHSIYAQIRKLEPGQVISFAGGHSARRTYFEFDFRHKDESLALHDAADQLERALSDAVEARLEADVPLGAFLSGGLDSSLVVAMMAKRLGSRLKTFSVGFDHPSFNELRHARLVSNHCGTVHHERVIGATEGLSAFDEVLRHFAEPFAFPSVIACYFMSKLARRDVTVALSGDAADELFCGYSRYKIFADLPAVAPESVHKLDLELLAAHGSQISQRYRAVYTDGLRDSLKRRLYSRGFRSRLGESFPRDYLEERFARGLRGPTPLDEVMAVDARLWLPDAQMAKVDIASMLHSLEVRCPFLDRQVIGLAARLPLSLKLAEGDEKRVLKVVARRYLPEEIVCRPKQELAVPLEAWLTGDVREQLASTLLSERALARGYFDADALRTLVTEWRPAHVYALWTMYALERWQLGAEQALDAPQLARRAGSILEVAS